MIEFIDDDFELSRLGRDTPRRLCLELRRSRPRYVILRRANCTTISNETHALGAYTARGYRKICMSNEAMLQAAAEREGRSDDTPSKRCGHCLSLIGS
jgi:hypothetical protein